MRSMRSFRVRSMLRSSTTSTPAASVVARPGRSSASGTADAVDEVFGHFGDVIVDDVGDVITMQSAGRDVGGDEHLEAAFLKSAEGAVALRLRAIAVNHGGGEAVAGQFLGEALGAALGAGEDERLSFFVVEKLAENIESFRRDELRRP